MGSYYPASMRVAARFSPRLPSIALDLVPCSDTDALYLEQTNTEKWFFSNYTLRRPRKLTLLGMWAVDHTVQKIW